MTEQEYDKLFNLMVKKFDLHKKQSTTDVFIKKGEISAIQKIINLTESQIKSKFLEKQRKLKSYKDDETSMKKFNIDTFGTKECKDIFGVYQYTKATLSRERAELSELEAIERVFDRLDLNLDESIRDIDLINTIKENKNNVSKDVEVRMQSGKCALKRPGRVKFPCNEPLVEGEKYCKEHLKQFNPERYYEIFETEEVEDKE